VAIKNPFAAAKAQQGESIAQARPRRRDHVTDDQDAARLQQPME
jgi:hypothetical protein